MKKILITGAAGFIGNHLGNRLTEMGHDVLGIDNYSNCHKRESDFEITTAEFENTSIETLKKREVVYHLAAYINVDESMLVPEEYFLNNATKTIEFARLYFQANPKGKLIYASSAEVYGTAQYPEIDEAHPLNPLSPYAVSKLAAEQMLRVFTEIYGWDITIIRNFNTFGENQSYGLYGGVIAKFINQALHGEDITVYGSGEQQRDYMHVRQAVDGYILALDKKLPSVINFGSGSCQRIIDIANFIAERTGAKITHLPPRANEIMMLKADISRAKEYGYQTNTSFSSDLEALIKHKQTT